MDRIEQLQQFLDEDPNDPFNTYALALEYQKINVGEAVALFDKLLTDHPNYLPAYYTFAQLLAELQESKKADSVFKTGIELARQLNEQKALKELNNAYSNWLFEQS